MAQELQTQSAQMNAISAIVLKGDLSKLDEGQRALYVKHVCERVGIDYLTKPFDFIVLNGKLTMYANRGATDQIRKVNRVSVNIVSREQVGDLLVVTARGKDSSGREDESVGAVNVLGLKGESLANAMMKCETKAKRRVTLSLCGLGVLDESEVADIPQGAINPKNMQPEPGDGIQEEGVQIPYGPLAKQMVHNADPIKLRKFVEEIEEKAEKLGKPIPKWAEPVIKAAEPIIAAYERQVAGEEADA